MGYPGATMVVRARVQRSEGTVAIHGGETRVCRAYATVLCCCRQTLVTSRAMFHPLTPVRNGAATDLLETAQAARVFPGTPDHRVSCVAPTRQGLRSRLAVEQHDVVDIEVGKE